MWFIQNSSKSCKIVSGWNWVDICAPTISVQRPQFISNSKIQFLNICPFSVVNDELVNYMSENLIGTFCTVSTCGFQELNSLVGAKCEVLLFLGATSLCFCAAVSSHLLRKLCSWTLIVLSDRTCVFMLIVWAQCDIIFQLLQTKQIQINIWVNWDVSMII